MLPRSPSRLTNDITEILDKLNENDADILNTALNRLNIPLAIYSGIEEEKVANIMKSLIDLVNRQVLTNDDLEQLFAWIGYNITFDGTEWQFAPSKKNSNETGGVSAEKVKQLSQIQSYFRDKLQYTLSTK